MIDSSLSIVSPLGNLYRPKTFISDIEVFVEKYRVGGLVFGWPVDIDGGLTPQCKVVYDFATQLSSRIELPATFWSEYRTTVEADNEIITVMENQLSEIHESVGLAHVRHRQKFDRGHYRKRIAQQRRKILNRRNDDKAAMVMLQNFLDAQQ